MNKSNNELKIMSFNIRVDTTFDKDHSWEFRKERVANEIYFFKPHIFGLQEALKHQLDYLANEFKEEYSYVGFGRDDGHDKGEFAPIFYDKDRIRLERYGVFWLSENLFENGSIGWDAVFPRIVTWAEFFDLKTYKKLFFFNTHFDHEGRIAQEKSAELLLQKVGNFAGNNPVVVTGDFNVEEDSKAYNIITNGLGENSDFMLFDAKYISKHNHYGPTITYNAYGQKNYQTKIDYIFVNDRITVLNHGILNSSWDNTYSSDHFPLVASIIIK
ncbi:endonuclease/exonuclease/phosphatase family protein [Caldicellulosiruptoraceae bacterium PP1]